MVTHLSCSTNYTHVDQEDLFRPPPQWQFTRGYSQLGSSRRRIGGAVLDAVSLRSLEYRRDPLFPLSLIFRNSRPVGHQVCNINPPSLKYMWVVLYLFLHWVAWVVSFSSFSSSQMSSGLMKSGLHTFFGGLQATVGLVISLLLLVDISLTLLMLLQFYSISLEPMLVVLLVPPLASVLPSAAGLNALFSHGPPRSAGLARVYALWNLTSFTNLVSTHTPTLPFLFLIGLHIPLCHFLSIR